jgi:hypothetical protein
LMACLCLLTQLLEGGFHFLSNLLAGDIVEVRIRTGRISQASSNPAKPVMSFLKSAIKPP